VAGKDAQVRSAQGAGRFDELALLDGENLRPHQARVAHPSADGQGQHQVQQAGAEECHKRNR